MTIITSTPMTTDQMLDARVSQTRQNYEQHLLQMNPQDMSDWTKVIDLKEEYAGATHAQRYNFVIQHHLAKTILSSS